MKATIAASKGATKTGKSDAATLLKADHRKVEQLFAQYQQNENEEEKRKLARQVCLELIVHTKIEEEIFYPACREKDVEDELLDEAQVEHDGAKVLIADLLRDSPGDEYYDAKVKTLSEYIKHHVGEEEKPRSGILAKAQRAGVDMAALGEKLQARKTELMAESEALCSQPPQPRSFTFNRPRRQSQETSHMPRYDDDNRGSRSNYRERDDQGRFMSDDDNGRSSRSSRSSRGSRSGSGWYGDPEGHSQASREGWDERYSGRQSRSRYDDDDDYRRSSSSRGGRGQGGWFGDPEGHSQASREGWRHSSHEGSGWYGDPEGHSEASREGWRHSSHEGSGWYGDPEGHSEASREGWDDRGRGRSRSSRSRDDDDDDDRRSSRGGRGGGRGHGGWFGDPEGHSQASREGWRDR